MTHTITTARTDDEIPKDGRLPIEPAMIEDFSTEVPHQPYKPGYLQRLYPLACAVSDPWAVALSRYPLDSVGVPRSPAGDWTPALIEAVTRSLGYSGRTPPKSWDTYDGVQTYAVSDGRMALSVTLTWDQMIPALKAAGWSASITRWDEDMDRSYDPIDIGSVTHFLGRESVSVYSPDHRQSFECRSVGLKILEARLGHETLTFLRLNPDDRSNRGWAPAAVPLTLTPFEQIRRLLARMNIVLPGDDVMAARRNLGIVGP